MAAREIQLRDRMQFDDSRVKLEPGNFRVDMEQCRSKVRADLRESR